MNKKIVLAVLLCVSCATTVFAAGELRPSQSPKEAIRCGSEYRDSGKTVSVSSPKSETRTEGNASSEKAS